MLKAAIVLALVALVLSLFLLMQGAAYGKTITLHDFSVPLLSAAVLLGLLDAGGTRKVDRAQRKLSEG